MKLQNACKYMLNVHGTDSEGNPVVAKVDPGDITEVDNERGETMLASGDWSRPGKKAKPKVRTAKPRTTAAKITDADTGDELETAGADGGGGAS